MTPWHLKQRPVGDWVIDRLDRTTMRVRRFGPFDRYEDAKLVYCVLVGRKTREASADAFRRGRVKESTAE